MDKETPKQKFVNDIIKSLLNDWQDWCFDDCTCSNSKSGIRLWIANVPILDLGVYKPTKMSFSLLQKFRVYQAMDKCRAKKLGYILAMRGAKEKV